MPHTPGHRFAFPDIGINPPGASVARHLVTPVEDLTPRAFSISPEEVAFNRRKTAAGQYAPKGFPIPGGGAPSPGFVPTPALYNPPGFIDAAVSAAVLDVPGETFISLVDPVFGGFNVEGPGRQRAASSRKAIGGLLRGAYDFAMPGSSTPINPRERTAGTGAVSMNEAIRQLSANFQERPFIQQLGADIVSGIVTGGTSTVGKAAALAAARAAARSARPVVRHTGRELARLAADEAGSIGLPRRTPNLPTQTHQPPPTGVELFGMQPIKSGLTPGEQLGNIVREAIGPWTGLVTPMDEFVQGSFREASKTKRVATNLGTTIAQQQSDMLQDAFRLNKSGQIESLAGVDAGVPGKGPTVQDLAARLPTFYARLTDLQKEAMEQLRRAYAPFRKLETEMGLQGRTRHDIITGSEGVPDGFYLPRGQAGAVGTTADAPILRGGFKKGNKAHERAARFSSMAEGIEGMMIDGKRKKYKYVPLTAALRGYATDIGSRVADKNTANYLESLVDPATGRPFYTTAATRANPVLRAKVTRFRTKIRGLSKTLRTRKTLAAEGAKSVKSAEAAVIRREVAAVSGAEKVTARIAADAEFDIKAIRKDMLIAIAEAENVAERIGANWVHLGQTTRKLSTAEGKLFKKVDGINDELERAWYVQSLPDVTQKQADRMTDHIERLWEQAAGIGESKTFRNIEARVDKLIEENSILKDRTKAERDAKLSSRQLERAASDTSRLLRVAEAEMRLLGREVSRANRQLTQASTRAIAREGRETATFAELASLQTDLASIRGEWVYEQSLARAGPRNTAVINLKGLEADSWPAHMANAANDIIKRETVNPNLFNAYNNLYRVLNATFDLSAVGIHGIVVAANSPKIAARSLALSIKSMGDPRVLGSFLRDFDRKALRDNLIDSAEWTRNFLRVGGPDFEFAMGVGPLTRLGDLPVFKQTNLAFGTWGDTARLQWANKLLKDEIKKGRSLDEIRASGDLQDIANSVNRLTGYSSEQLGGKIGDLLLFAPRFLQSQLESVVFAARGTLPNAPLEAQIARKSLIYLMGMCVSMTVAVNTTRGRTTEFNPLASNFMRIKDVAGRDWSVCGPWDSLLKAAIHVMKGNPHDAWRSKGSGIVSQGWDLFTGRSAIDEDLGGQVLLGEKLFDINDGMLFAKNMILAPHTPFSLEESPSAVKMALKGEPAEAAALVLGEGLGIKSAELSLIERVTQARFDVLKSRPELLQQVEDERTRDALLSFIGRNEPIPQSEIPGNILREIDKVPSVRLAKIALQDDRIKRGSGYAKYREDLDGINFEIDGNISRLGVLFNDKQIDGKMYRNRLSELQSERSTRKTQLRKSHTEDLEFLDDLDPKETSFDIALSDYYDTLAGLNPDGTPMLGGDGNPLPPLEDEVTGAYDIDEHKRREGLWSARYPASRVQEVADFRTGNYDEVQKELDRDREALQGYWGTLDEVLIGVDPEARRLYDEWKAATEIDKSALLSVSPRLGGIFGAEAYIKLMKRGNGLSLEDAVDTAEIDRKLIKWGYVITPVNPIVMQEVLNAARRRNQ